MKYMGIFLCVILVSVILSVSSAHAVSEFDGQLESLTDQAIVEGDSLDISGWAVHTEGVEAVDVYVDGRLAGRAEYGAVRKDVAEALPAYSNSVNSGFRYMLDLTGVPQGPHNLSIKGVSKQGTSFLVARKSFKRERSFQGKLNMPSTDRISLSGHVLKMAGWVSSDKPLKAVQIWLDHYYIGDARIGLPTAANDKSDRIPSDSKFEYDLDITKSYKGEHLAQVIIQFEDGTTAELGRVTFAKPFNYAMLFVLFFIIIIGYALHRVKKRKSPRPSNV
ncbi:hypothetical protein PaecuDRAFT_4141 [Paenibacillus curdlanolyticus YK9]|uniref:Uncharacterized protein n=1 Tax=Paenibacillus curdlanolyticus YK9 TaxID=717606 RepID=E0IEQ0_9BACL|nr:Ig-like domain-containing protein [Paenibacillus curdlanolyticus]EFM09138.1 hypothetical protein PaecuDRAFT_4141 [Paenibacillus curdlanolyticus YK9]